MVIKNHTTELGRISVSAFMPIFWNGKDGVYAANHGLAKMVFGYGIVS